MKELKSRGRAFTLAEILICIAIICVLAAILIPSLVQGKIKAKQTSDLSQMHQLGLAGALYVETDGPYFPRSCALLVSASKTPKELCSGQNDPTDKGIASLFAAQFRAQKLGENGEYEPFRNSFVGYWECGGTSFLEQDRYENLGMNPGWLLDFSTTEQNWKNPFSLLDLGGYFVRLQRDTSIKKVPSSALLCPNTVRGTAVSIFLWYDFTQRDKEEICKEH